MGSNEPGCEGRVEESPQTRLNKVYKKKGTDIPVLVNQLVRWLTRAIQRRSLIHWRVWLPSCRIWMISKSREAILRSGMCTGNCATHLAMIWISSLRDKLIYSTSQYRRTALYDLWMSSILGWTVRTLSLYVSRRLSRLGREVVW